MNPRLTTAVVGTITLLLGLAGLFYPERVLGLLGLAVADPAHAAAALGEVRAMYGGIFVVLGVFTCLAALDPGRNRGRVLLIALLWFGAFGGRLFGAFRDGSPGLPGWLALAFELVMGGALVIAAQTAEAPLESTLPPAETRATAAGEPV
jgi:hypothetical protein